MDWFAELKRRNVFRVGAAYIVGAWFVIQVSDLVLDNIGAPVWVIKAMFLTLAIGFFLTLIFSWAYEITPEGIKRERDVERDESVTRLTAKRLDIITIALLVLALGALVADRFLPDNYSPETNPATLQNEAENNERGKSIAVLPFADMSSAGDQQYFSDGMAEEILNALIKVPDLRVAGRTSSFSFKGKGNDIREIGQVLNVTHILEGSVRKQGNRVRITAQLVNSDDGIRLWTDTYDGSLDDVFDLQESISRKVVSELNVLLTGSNRSRLAPNFTNKSKAYELFLKGRDLSRRAENHEEIWVQAFDLLVQAVESDPNFTEAWAELGRAYADSAGSSQELSQVAMYSKAEVASQTALNLDSENTIALVTLGVVNWRRGDRLKGIEFIEKGLEHDPNYALGHYYRGLMNAVVGRSKSSIPHFQRAVELDPYRGWNWVEYARAIAVTGDLEESDRLAQKAVELSNSSGLSVQSTNARFRGETQLSYGLFIQSVELSGENFEGAPPRPVIEVFARAIALGNEQDKATARAIMLTLAHSDADTLSAGALYYFPYLGMIDELFELAPNNIEASDWLAGDIWRPVAEAREVRQHPGFAKFADEMGYLEVWRASGWPDLCFPDTSSNDVNERLSCN